jgi:phosphatidate cytidylyltransferase
VPAAVREEPSGLEVPSADDELEAATAALLAQMGEEAVVEEGEEGDSAPAFAAEVDGFGREPSGLVLSAREALEPEAPEPGIAGSVLEVPGAPTAAEPEVAEPEMPKAGMAVPVAEAGPVAAAAAPEAVPGVGPAPAPLGESRAEPLAPTDEAEVDEWLAFVEGAPAGRPAPPRAAVSSVPGPEAVLDEPYTGGAFEEEAPGQEAVDEEIGAGRQPSREAPAARRRWWGRRRKEAEPAEAEATAPEPETEAFQPPPWAPPVPAPALSEAAVLEEQTVAADERDEAEEEEEEAAWEAWVGGEPGAGPRAGADAGPAATVLPPVEPEVEASRPGSREDDTLPLWAEADWAGEQGPPVDWYAPVDEDEAVAPPAALPEEEWEDEGWEAFPEPGTPLPEPEAAEADGAGRPVEAEAGPVAAGWETFPEPGVRPPRAPDGGAGWQPSPEPVVPLGRPQAPAPEVPSRVFDLEGPPRRQGPISEETLAGAVTMEHRGLAEEVAAADTAETELQALSAHMPGLESGVVGFEDVAHLGEGAEVAAEAPARSDLPVRVATGMVLAALLLGSLWVGGEFLAGFVGLLLILGLGELYGALRRSGYQPLALFGFLGGIGILVGTWFYGAVAIPLAVVATTVLSFFYYAFAPRRRDALTNGGLTLLGMLWVTGTGVFAFPIAASPHFRDLILALAATVVATDVGAFFAGRAWGERPMAPVLSPHKTWEGLAGGVVLGIGVAAAVGYLRGDAVGLRTGIALGLVVAVMAPLGDLAESMVKRSLGVKDMGSILPGHGGILDRLDAFLFVLPAAWVLFETMGKLR